jgi:type I restriction enzyme S subunit
MTWRAMSLRDCAKFSSGGTPHKGTPEYWIGDIPWVSSGEMVRQFIDDTSLHISEAGAFAGSRLVPAGTIFAVVRGMSLAKEFRVAFATRPMAFNQDLKALTVKDGIDPYFLFSSLRSHAARICDLSTEAAHGTKKLEMERLESFQLLVPGIETQRRIGGIVKAYDDLIENNQRRIKLLEEAARRLYREWFVALRFPGHERVKVVDGVPKGWTFGALSDSLCYLNRGVSPQYNDSAPGLVVNQKCIRNGLLDLSPARRQAKEVPQEKLLQLGDVLINSTGTGTLGRVAMVRSPVGDCTADTHVTIARPANQAAMAFWGVALLEMEARFSEMGVGATNQQELIRSHVGAIELLVPPTDLQADFHARAWPMLLQSDTLSKQSGVLQQARDGLLPRLMSGALTV